MSGTPSNVNAFDVLRIKKEKNQKDEGQLILKFPQLIYEPRKRCKNSSCWHLEHLRGYGQESDRFSFECGRMNPDGPGLHFFKVLRDKNSSDIPNISMILDQQIKINEGLEEAYGTMGSKNQNPTGEVYSTLGATPRAAPSSSVYASLGARSSKDAPQYETPDPRGANIPFYAPVDDDDGDYEVPSAHQFKRNNPPQPVYHTTAPPKSYAKRNEPRFQYENPKPTKPR